MLYSILRMLHATMYCYIIASKFTEIYCATGMYPLIPACLFFNSKHLLLLGIFHLVQRPCPSNGSPISGSLLISYSSSNAILDSLCPSQSHIHHWIRNRILIVIQAITGLPPQKRPNHELKLFGQSMILFFEQKGHMAPNFILEIRVTKVSEV
jgi:hypothetical protein